MKKIVTGIFVTILAFFVNGCAGTKTFVRTSFDRWERFEVKEMNLSVELPRGAKKPSIGGYFDDPTNKVFIIKMHWIYPSGFLADPMSTINLSVNRLSASAFKTHTEGRYPLVIGREYAREDFPSFTTDLMSKTLPYIYGTSTLLYRKDYKAPNGDVVLAGAEMMPCLLQSSYPYLEQDKAAVERILNSIQVK